ncbi:uncharacterized protein LOC117897283 [Drosophila subobscura]|uniref:uncharacterized protein LOC117897283 n=1 Tax=Drosophila subobscura TaxID=7241 RepID=UPI00155B18DE|nr:uncharacterized protein LOC117897283 [Drosophila subobscura]
MTKANTTGLLLVDLIKRFGRPIGYKSIMDLISDASEQSLSKEGRRTVRETLDAAIELGFLQQNGRCQFIVSPLTLETTLTIMNTADLEDNCSNCDSDSLVDPKVEALGGDSLMTMVSTFRRNRIGRARPKKSGSHSSAKGHRSGAGSLKYKKSKPRPKNCLHCQRKMALEN